METRHKRAKIFGQVTFLKDDLRLHSAFWVLLFALHYINFAYTDKQPDHLGALVTAALTILSTIGVAYVHTYFLLPKTFGNPRFELWQGLIIYIPTTLFLIILSDFIFALLGNSGLLGFIAETKNLSWERNLPETFFNTYLLTGLVYMRKWFHSSEELRLQNELLQKDFELLNTNKELLEKENQLNLYKMQTLNWQIKPHFLFNALNNIYIKTMRSPSLVGDAILQFSDTMRYIVYDSLSDRVPLSNEVDFICNYLELSLQGLPPESYRLTLKIDTIPEHVRIMPLILITFVENAVKYGIQKSEKEKWIDMTLELKDNILNLQIKNSQSLGVTGRDMQSSGKGIANTRERLKIGYPNHHQLQLNSAGDVFDIKLMIEL
jgi:two-component system, LytTR family, sensor histidine kinase AlgZ